MKPGMVVQVHAFHGRFIHPRIGHQWPVRNGVSLATTSFLNNPMTVPAPALSNASQIEPIEGTSSSLASICVYLCEVHSLRASALSRYRPNSDLDRSYISGVERGVRTPTLDVVVKLMHELGIGLAELLSTLDLSR